MEPVYQGLTIGVAGLAVGLYVITMLDEEWLPALGRSYRKWRFERNARLGRPVDETGQTALPFEYHE